MHSAQDDGRQKTLSSILENRNFQRFLNTAGSNGKPLTAIFDCDGTMIKGDVGEAMLYYQLEHFLFRKSPAEVWEDYPRRDHLQALFSLLSKAPAESRTALPAFGQFADAVLDRYFGQIEDGHVAKACADIVRLFAGYEVAEVRRIARESFEFERRSTVSNRVLGSRTLPLGIRYISETLELLRSLREKQFEIWVVSGSSKWSVEPVFAPLGIPHDRVIGIELIEEHGVLTPREIVPVPIRSEKVAAFRRHSDRIPLLVASDSRNDIPLFNYASQLKVRINSRGRSTQEFFRDLGEEENDSWINVENPTILEDGIS